MEEEEGEKEEEEEKEALLSQRGAAGSRKDVCPVYLFTSQQLGRPGVGRMDPGSTHGESWGEGAKADHHPQIPSLALPELTEEAESPPTPSPTPSL